MTPESVAPAPIQSRDEAEAAGGIVATLDIQIDKALLRKNKIALLIQRRDRQIQEFRGRRTVQALRLKAWLEKDRSFLLSESKSLELRHVTLAFREGNRAIVFLKDMTEALVLKNMRRLKKRFGDYIRIREEIDRQQLLKDTRPEVAKLNEKYLKKVGLAIGRETWFSCESKLDKAE